MSKNHFFGKKISWTGFKNNFELKMLKLLENHVKTHAGLGGVVFFGKNGIFWHFKMALTQEPLDLRKSEIKPFFMFSSVLQTLGLCRMIRLCD